MRDSGEDDAGAPSQGRAQGRGDARRQAFLEAAREVFLERGYVAASVNDVVRKAGGSLATLYAQFRNKDGLFLAVCEDQHERFIAAMLPARNDALPLEQGLAAIGEQYVRALMTRDQLNFFRIAIGGARTHPQVLQRYLIDGAERTRAVVAGYLRARATAEGRVLADPETAAAMFFGLLRGRHLYAALAYEDYSMTPDDLDKHVREAVRVFMGGAFESPPSADR